MSRRIILHIGPPKTGTSSLQETLFAAQDELMAQGVAYPTLGRHDRMPRAAGHHGLPAVTQIGAPLPAPLLEWVGDLPAGHSVVLSSEDFSHLSAEQVAHLAAQLPGAAVEVVYYARRWDRLLPSVWQELVKHGASCSYPVYANLQTAAPRASVYLNYAQVLDRWVAGFGMASIRLFSFDNAIMEMGDIVTHFCRAVLGDVTVSPREDDGQNHSMEPVDAEILRQLNRLTFGADWGDASVRQRLWQRAFGLEEEIVTLERVLTPYLRRCRPCAPLVLHQLEQEMLARYRDSLENPTPEGFLFKREDFREAAFVDSAHLLMSDSPALIRDLHRKLDLPLAAVAGASPAADPESRPAAQSKS
ncbi:hypothetical protein [Tritonibacter scottomollicae]|uniref:hypothetical protein n=1 Tax=Tritonibacter scottomollicae TaxID=483013 RepID=UPI003AA7AB09